MLKSKQGKSIETWHVGLCPHATQKDIRHTSRHDWVSTYVPKMVNILPQSQHGTKIPNQRGFPCSYIEQNLQLALRLLLVSYLCLSLIHPPENSISLSDPSIPFPSSSTPLKTRKQLNSAKTIFATSMFAHGFTFPPTPLPQNKKNDRLLLRENLVGENGNSNGSKVRNLGIPIISSSMGKRLWHDSPEPKTVGCHTTRQGRPGRTVVLRRTETKNKSHADQLKGMYMLQVSSIRCYWYLLWGIIIELCLITRLYRLVIRLQKHRAKKKEFLIGPTKEMLINLNLFTSKLFLIILLVSKKKKKFLKTWELKLQLCIFSPAWEKIPVPSSAMGCRNLI